MKRHLNLTRWSSSRHASATNDATRGLSPYYLFAANWLLRALFALLCGKIVIAIARPEHSPQSTHSTVLQYIIDSVWSLIIIIQYTYNDHTILIEEFTMNCLIKNIFDFIHYLNKCKVQYMSMFYRMWVVVNLCSKKKNRYSCCLISIEHGIKIHRQSVWISH